MMTLAEVKKKYRWDSLDVIVRFSIIGYGYSGLGLFLMILAVMLPEYKL